MEWSKDEQPRDLDETTDVTYLLQRSSSCDADLNVQSHSGSHSDRNASKIVNDVKVGDLTRISCYILNKKIPMNSLPLILSYPPQCYNVNLGCCRRPLFLDHPLQHFPRLCCDNPSNASKHCSTT